MITKVKWRNHTVFGDLELDFAKDDDTPYNTIVLAGENGTGKTSILETLATFLNRDSFEPFKYISYTANGNIFTASRATDEEAGWGYYDRINDVTGEHTRIRSNRNVNKEQIDEDADDIRHYGYVYSRARSGFKTNAVKSIDANELDSSRYSNDRSDDYTSIKSLLISVDNQDNSEWKNISKSGTGTTWTEFSQTSKMYRFEHAFNSFFDNIAYDRIDTSGSEFNVLFTKHGKRIVLDDLSTGEKQIVFRGAYLLKNIHSLDGGIVLIDEPELSMHPKWQQKILEFYRNLFNVDGKQTVQMIIATHSEYVVKSALEDSDNVLVIALEDNNGVVKARRIQKSNMLLPTITAAETNYVAFGIPSIDYHTELYGYLQYKSNTLNSIRDCDDYIKNSTQYNQAIHYKLYTVQRNGRPLNYETLPTYIRNCIDHPDAQHRYSDNEMETSIKLLIELCK